MRNPSPGLAAITERHDQPAVSEAIAELRRERLVAGDPEGVIGIAIEGVLLVVSERFELILAETTAEQEKLRSRIAASERTFFARLIPIFTLFVAVVALIVTIAQSGAKVV